MPSPSSATASTTPPPSPAPAVGIAIGSRDRRRRRGRRHRHDGRTAPPLPLLVGLSRETVRIIRQNILVFAFGVNLVGIVLTGWLWPLFASSPEWYESAPLAAVIYHQFGSLAVLLNSMRLLAFDRTDEPHAVPRPRRREVGRRVARPLLDRRPAARGRAPVEGRSARALAGIALVGVARHGVRAGRARRGRRGAAVRRGHGRSAAGVARPLAVAGRDGHPRPPGRTPHRRTRLPHRDRPAEGGEGSGQQQHLDERARRRPRPGHRRGGDDHRRRRPGRDPRAPSATASATRASTSSARATRTAWCDRRRKRCCANWSPATASWNC